MKIAEMCMRTMCIWRLGLIKGQMGHLRGQVTPKLLKIVFLSKVKIKSVKKLKSDVKMTEFCMRTTRAGRPGQTVHFRHFRTGYSGRQYFFF